MQDIHAYPGPAIAVDLAILCIEDGALKVLLTKRNDGADTGGAWALPGGFVRRAQMLSDAVAHVLRVKTGLRDVHFEQLGTYDALDRDPRGHVISVVYLAIVPNRKSIDAALLDTNLTLAEISVDWPGETGGTASARTQTGALSLAFDHADILGDLVKRLRGKLDYTPIGFAFLPTRFTLRDVQEVHETILGLSLTKPAFRRKLLDRHALRATGDRETGGAYRPAELYERIAITE